MNTGRKNSLMGMFLTALIVGGLTISIPAPVKADILPNPECTDCSNTGDSALAAAAAAIQAAADYEAAQIAKLMAWLFF